MKRRAFVMRSAGSLAGIAIGTSFSNTLKPTNMNRIKFRTPLCDVLHIEYPIIQAGMGEFAGPELAAAVSNAGGLGILAGTMVPPDVLRENIRRTRALTSKPFGVNLLLQRDLMRPADDNLPDETVQQVQGMLNRFRKKLDLPDSYAHPEKLPPLIEKDIEVIIEERVPVFSIGLGSPSAEVVQRCRENGILVMAMVCTVEDALEVEKAGIDILVAQGSEAGGHRSTWVKKASAEHAGIGLMSLLPQVIKNVKIPVVAAGGISTGQAIIAALQLGAQGALLGTRFAVTNESLAPDCYKKKIIESNSDQTTVTDVFTGMYARVIRNEFTDEYTNSKAPVLPPGRQLLTAMDVIRTAGKKQNSQYYTLYSGQGIDQVESILQAKEVMEQLVTEAVKSMQAFPATVQAEP